MSTRSGKRIHASLHENTVGNVETAMKSERKTRSKHMKENNEEPNIVLQKFKKRENYVSYPTDDEQLADIINLNENEGKHTRTSRKNVLKELNPTALPTESSDNEVPPKTIRLTRRTRKYAEIAADVAESEIQDLETTERKTKKSKRKHFPSEHAETEKKTAKRKNKKKKDKRSNSFGTENVAEEIIDNNIVNNINVSNDSFHSAAGSPVKEDIKPSQIEGSETISDEITLPEKSKRKAKKIQSKHKSIDDLISEEQDHCVNQNGTFNKIDKPKSKTSFIVGADVTDAVTTIRKSDADISLSNVSHKNDTFDIEEKAGTKKSSIIRAGFNDSVTKIRKSDVNISLSKVDRNKNEFFDTDQKGSKKKSSIKSAGFDDPEAKLRKSDANILLSEDDQDKNYTFDLEQKKDKKKLCIKNAGFNDSLSKIRKSDANISKENKKNYTFNLEQRKSGDKQESSINNAYLDDSLIKIRQSNANSSLRKDNENKNDTFDIEQKSSNKNESITKIINTTFEKESVGSASKSRKRKSPVDIMDIIITSDDLQTDKKPSLNSTYDKADISVKVNTTFEFDNSPNKTKKKSAIDTTFEKETGSPKIKLCESGNTNQLIRKSQESYKHCLTGSLNMIFDPIKVTEKLNNTFDNPEKINTIDKDQNLNATFDKLSKSLISSDSNSEDVSRISITSDESITEPKLETVKKPVTIMNITPVLIDSSIEDSLISEDSKTEVITPLKREETFSLEETKSDTVPLKREGTFTKDGPDDPSADKESPATPKKNASLSSPGNTPFPNKSSNRKPMLNVTRSIEKPISTLEPAPRVTRVMFCSPVNNPVVVAQQRKTVIKSNLKGSNKSFVYEEVADSPPVRPTGRKRSHTHSEADDALVKRKRLTEDLRQSVDRLSRPRTSSANAKLTDLTPSKKSTTPSKAKVPRTKLPNFAAMHQKQFDKMESLDECQNRKAKRARQLLTPIPGVNLPEKTSPKVTDSPKEQPKKEIKKPETLIKSFSQEASKPAYTRFGFKLNLDVNPFSIPSKSAVKKDNPNGLKRQATLPSLTGATSVRREVAKQVVMREKSFSDKRLLKRNENRTIIKGVRTNRRFELQMKLRNIE